MPFLAALPVSVSSIFSCAVSRATPLIFVVVLGLIAGCQKAPVEKHEPIRLVRTVTVAGEPLQQQLSFSGQVKSRYETNLGFRVSGKLISRDVEIGSQVRPGQVLARLETADLNLTVQAAQADVRSAEADRGLAALNFRRYDELRKKALISQLDFDRQRALLSAATERAVAARARLTQAQNQVQYATLRADAAGVVTAINVEVGQLVAAGQPVLELDRSAEREVRISVPEQQRDALRQAQSITIRLWSKPEHGYAGRLREVAPSTDALTRTYTAKIAVTNADADLQPGMTAQVLVDLPVQVGQISLPLSVLYTKSARAHVWIVDPVKFTVKLVPVETAGLAGDQVIIRSGLHAGDIVVSAGANLLVPGQVVKLADSTP